jgi:hypothetical protein
MRGAARLEYESKFTAGSNYEQLIAIYRNACRTVQLEPEASASTAAAALAGEVRA